MGFRKIIGMAMTAVLITATPVSASNWVKAESAHFTVFSDLNAKTAEAYLTKLEQYRYILSGFYGITKEDDATTPKLRVYFVDTLADLRQTSPGIDENIAGYFKSCAEGQGAVALYKDDVIRETKDVKAQQENPSQAILFHEYAHDFMFQHGAGEAYPPWFVEGFAEFYSTTKIQGDEAIVGMAFSWRVNSLGYQGASIHYDDLLRDTWRPKKPGLTRDYAENAFYAESWLLTHWILSDPRRNAQFQTFIDAYRKHEDPVVAFERTFGVKVKDLDHILETYFDHMKAQVYRIRDMPAPKVVTTTLPASAGKLLLWDAATRMCPAHNDRPDFLTKIRTEAAKYPDDAFAQDVLARAEIVIGDEWKALDYLKARIAAHPDDAEAQYMLGQTWYLMTVHKHIVDGETADSQRQAARAALGRSYQLDPLYAPDLYYYSLALEVPGQAPSDNMISAAEEAQALAPSVDTYAVHAASLLAARDRLSEAKIMLVPLASNPHAPEESAWAANIIAIIDRGGTSQEVLAALKTPVSKDPPASSGKDAPPSADKPK